MRILLIEVGHAWHEPTIYCFLQVNLACVWVEHWSKLIACLQIKVVGFLLSLLLCLFQPLRSVQPVAGWHILYPWVLQTAVVENHIHNDFQSFGVSLIGESLILLVGTEARVNTVVVGSGIAVIGAEAVVVGRIVLQHRSEPKSRNTQLVEIVEMLADAFKVAAMAQTRLGAVVLICIHALYLVVVAAATGKAVGHKHIENVFVGKAMTLCTSFLALFQLVLHLLTIYLQSHLARLCTA